MKMQAIGLQLLLDNCLIWGKYNFTLTTIILFLILHSFNVNADYLKVLHKIEFNKSASKKLISTLVQEFNYNDPVPETVYYALFDLNNDKHKEYLFYFSDYGWCGSKGCHITIASKKNLKINPLLEVTSSDV